MEFICLLYDILDVGNNSNTYVLLNNTDGSFTQNGTVIYIIFDNLFFMFFLSCYFYWFVYLIKYLF